MCSIIKYIETIKIVDGVAQNLEYHKRRMYSSSKFIMPELIVPEEHQKGVYKCRVIYSSFIEKIEYIEYIFPTFEKVKLIEDNDIEYSFKYENRSKIDALFAERGDCSDIIVVKNGLVTDSSFCNLVFKNSHGLFTPATPLLHGTKRALLIDNNIIEPAIIRADDIANYDQLIFINAMIDVEDNVNIPTNFIVD